MLKTISALTASLVLSISLPVTAAVNDFTVKGKNVQRHCKQCTCTFFISYPQLSGKNTKVTKPINTAVEKEFLKWRNLNCQDLEKGDKYQEEAQYEVKLKDKGLFSVYYLNVGVLTPSAHPNNALAGFNYSLKTGKPVTLKQLFKKNTNIREVLKKAITASLKKQEIDIEPEYNDNYDFYLTPTHLVIISMFDSHAAQGAEAPISYKDLAAVLDKNGPLKELLK